MPSCRRTFALRTCLRTILAAVLLLLLLLPAAAPAQDRLLIGLIPEMNIFKQKQRFKLLGEYLARKTGIPVTFTILSRYGNIIESFTSEKMDGAFFGSFTGALAIQKLGVIPLARPINLDNTSRYCGYIFVRKDSGIRGPEDMSGKRMAFVEKATTAGYIFPRAWFRKYGITDLDRFFGETFFTGSHDAAIMAVLDRTADVGAAKHSIYDRVRMKNPRIDRELLILARSPWVPSNGLCVRRDLDAGLRQKLKDALLGIEQDPGGRNVLEKFGALRFIETTREDYRPVLDMAGTAGIDIRTYDYRNE
jgi:phosphonate transport system substrate-binding protein